MADTHQDSQIVEMDSQTRVEESESIKNAQIVSEETEELVNQSIEDSCDQLRSKLDKLMEHIKREVECRLTLQQISLVLMKKKPQDYWS